MHKVSSAPISETCTKFFPRKTWRKRTGAVKYVCTLVFSYAKLLYAGAIKIKMMYPTRLGKNASEEIPFLNPDNIVACEISVNTKMGGKKSSKAAMPLRTR